MYEIEKWKYKVVKFINVIQSPYLRVGCYKLKMYTIYLKSSTRYHNKECHTIRQQKNRESLRINKQNPKASIQKEAGKKRDK